MKRIYRLNAWFFLILVALGMPKAEAAGLTSWTTPLFSGAGSCAFCHDQANSSLTDAKGGSVSITEDWRGTMMSHAFKDPLWRAVMEAEVMARPKLKSYIEDKCLTCHAPMPRTQQAHDRQGELSFATAKLAPLASEGVGCTFCHQIQPTHLGKPASFSGHYDIQPTRQIFGPYDDVLTMPMQRHVNYTPELGSHMQDSSLCATCHTLHTPILGPDLEVIGQFPEQTPFLEWQASDYPRNGKHCQDCHMQRLDEPIKISSRPPWLDPRQPFWRHQFVGGNVFMLQFMARHAKAIDPNASDETLATTVSRAREQLRHAARVEAVGHRETNTLHLDVTVANLAGHKFPTGHPYRRAWLHVRVADARGRTLFESGAPGDRGDLLDAATSWMPHFDQITQPNQVQIYESVMGDAEGRRTYGLLRATKYLKDNRLPPRGFPDVVDADIAVRGQATSDANFNPSGRGTDQVAYRIDLGRTEGPLEATVALLYQSVPPEAVAHLDSVQGEASRAFMKFYRQADKTPETVHQITLHIEASRPNEPSSAGKRLP
jgi:hypothetical protein